MDLRDRTSGAAIMLSLIAGTAPAAEVITSFEFDDASGVFTLGAAPRTATFMNGAAEFAGAALRHGGVRSWRVDGAGGEGVITFEAPARSLDLFARDQFADTDGVLTVFDVDDAVLLVQPLDHADWTHVQITRDPLTQTLIGRVTLARTGANGATAIDDLIYNAADASPPIDDPIPGPIPASRLHVQLQPVATGLTAPNWGTAAPGIAGRLFVTDQDGIVWNVRLGGSGLKTIFLDISARLVPLGIGGPNSFDERGLLGIAFHPNYAANGRVYTYTSEPTAAGTPDFSTLDPGQSANHLTTLTEWTVANPADPNSEAETATARVLLRIAQPQFNHNAGCVNFGPDGMLYIALGDGGGADDQNAGHGPFGNGQNALNPLGSILRIDPLGNDSANGQYGIPADNPFVDPNDARVDEAFAYGFRNPFRFSFDSLTGALYAADVGQNDLEEIDVVVPGGNYGWKLFEGSFPFNDNAGGRGFVQAAAHLQGTIPPIAEYDHDEGIAIVGGFVYRGARVPPLFGQYVFGEFARTFSNDGRLFHLDEGGGIVEFNLVGQAQLGLSVLGIGQDGSGEQYLLTNTTGTPFGETGVIYRIAGRPADIDIDGDVDLDDLLFILGRFGEITGGPVDVDEDGQVDMEDLMILLAEFGT